MMEDGGQMRLSDDDLGITKKDKQEAPQVAVESGGAGAEVEVDEQATEATEAPEITEAAPKTESPEEVFHRAQKSMVRDPFTDKNPQELSLEELLDREFSGGWEALWKDSHGRPELGPVAGMAGRDKLGVISKILIQRIGSPENVRSLATGYRALSEQRIESRLSELDAEEDRLDNRHDIAADYARIDLRNEEERLRKTLTQKAKTGDEIVSYLNQLAEDWENNPRLWPPR